MRRLIVALVVFAVAVAPVAAQAASWTSIVPSK